MANTKYFVFLTVLLVVFGGMLWRDMDGKENIAGESGKDSGAAAAPAPEAPFSRESTWTHEQHWLVDEIIRDVAEMVAFASKGAALDPASVEVATLPEGGDGRRYQVAVRGFGEKIEYALALEDHLWAAGNYAPLAKSLIGKWKPQPSGDPSAENAGLPGALTQPDTVTLIRESKRVSDALTRHPLQAALHEEAALVLGTLAFREAAGRFTDIRPALSRMTAHLALARAMEEEAGLCGQLAGALQLALIDRQADAAKAAAGLAAGMEPWANALRSRATGDWRLLKSPGKATLLEQIAHARSLTRSVNAQPLQAFIEAHEPPSVPDWSRLALETNFSVEEGHVFAMRSVPLEFSAAAAVYKEWSGKELQKLPELAAVLDDPAGRAVTKQDEAGARLQVLSWGTLAAFHQRHLFHAVERTHFFFQKRWGVPEEAASLEEMVQQQLSKLRLYPLLQAAGVCGVDALPIDRAAAVAFCEAHPQSVTAAVWAALENPKAGRSDGPRPPPARRWFAQGLIYGAPFEYPVRHCELHCVPAGGDTAADKLAEAAPWQYHILYDWASKKPGGLAGALKSTLDPIADYHLNAAWDIADQSQHDPKAYIEAMQKVAAISPNTYMNLGSYLTKRGLNDEAAAAYEAAFEKATDRVRMSNNSDWLINYYFDKGEKEKALTVAEEAAEVYSARGLEAAANLMIRMERWVDAQEYFEAIAERYGNLGPLIGYLQKYKDRVADVEAQFNAWVGKIFPKGMKQAALEDFQDPPRNGAVFTTRSELTEQHGIQPGMVAVALDGYAVQSMDQYDFIRALSPGAPLRLILWDGAAYKELTAAVPDRRFQCGLETYFKQ